MGAIPLNGTGRNRRAGTSGIHGFTRISGIILVSRLRAGFLKRGPSGWRDLVDRLETACRDDEDVLALIRKSDPQIRLSGLEILERRKYMGEPSSLTRLVLHDPVAEVRWAAVEVLSKNQTPAATALLEDALSDPSEKVRYSAARALVARLGPGRTPDPLLLAGLGKWEELTTSGPKGTALTAQFINDRSVTVRRSILEACRLSPQPVCDRAAVHACADPDPEVRHEALMTCSSRGISPGTILFSLEKTPYQEKNPSVAIGLNFFFLGLGYNYLGFWYGFLLFQLNMTFILMLGLVIGPLVPQVISYLVSAGFCVHTWRITKKPQGIRVLQ